MVLYIFLFCILVTNIFLCIFILYQVTIVKDSSLNFYTDLLEEISDLRNRSLRRSDLDNLSERIEETLKSKIEINKKPEDKWKNFHRAFGGHREKDDG